jgi:hypothetical protein
MALNAVYCTSDENIIEGSGEISAQLQTSLPPLYEKGRYYPSNHSIKKRCIKIVRLFDAENT